MNPSGFYVDPKCAVKFSTVARIVKAESVAGKIYCESIIVKRIW